MRKLTERQRRGLSRLLRAEDRHMAMSPDLAKQLARRGIVRITDHVLEDWKWGKVVGVLPVVALAIGLEAAQKLAAPKQEEKE